MKCPACDASHIGTNTTRQVDALTVLRIRHCNICRHKWLTAETVRTGKVNFATFPPTVELDP